MIKLAVLLALAIGVQIVRDREYAPRADQDQILYVRSGEVLKRIALSYDALLADVYWVRALQHYGRERLESEAARKYESLYPLLDLATRLDPSFTVAYRFGAIFLSEAHPGGAGRPDQAIALLKNGIAANPGKWDYYHDVGFIYYWNLHDYSQAAEWFRRGGEIPGSPWWLRTYAATMLSQGGDRAASRALWQQMGQAEDNAWLRQTARLRLMQLDALDQIDALEQVVNRFRQTTGALPQSWDQLVAARLLPGVPLDTAGTPFTLEFSTGKVLVAPWSKLQPMPKEP